MLSVHRLTAGAGYQYMMRGDTLTLPSTYVQESVELAYATTVHRAQGATVETAHLLVTEQLTRALLYVGMTRGRHANMAYVATHQSTTDLHEPHPEQTMQDVLETVLQDPGVELSAHEVMRRELDNATRLDRLIPIHEHLCQLDARTHYVPQQRTAGSAPATKQPWRHPPLTATWSPSFDEPRRPASGQQTSSTEPSTRRP